MSKEKKKIKWSEESFTDFEPTRIALKFDPPVITLEYLVTFTGKLYHHKMELESLSEDSNTDLVMQKLEEEHKLYFMSNKLDKNQIRNMVQRIKSHLQVKSSVKRDL